jgi:hypothetical protein
MCHKCANISSKAVPACPVCRKTHPSSGACRDCGVMETCAEEGLQMWRCGDCGVWVCGGCAEKCAAQGCEKALCAECRTECLCGKGDCHRAAICKDTERCGAFCDICFCPMVNDCDHFLSCQAEGCGNIMCLDCMRLCDGCDDCLVCEECTTCDFCEGADSDSEQVVRQSGTTCQG